MTHVVPPRATLGRKIEELKDAALSAYRSWDLAWPDIQRRIEQPGQAIRCHKRCNPCCFTRKFCSLSEAAAILSYMQDHFRAEKQEALRMRVESAASTLRLLRADGYCASEERYFLSGGHECSFLEQGCCSIYPVRPLSCRAAASTNGSSALQCRQCPAAVLCTEPEKERRELTGRLLAREETIGVRPLPLWDPPATIPEALSDLWEQGAPAPVALLSPEAWRQRLESREGPRDQTWQDDRSDFQVSGAPLVLPEERDYPRDLTLICQRPEEHELYGQLVSGDGIPEFRSLYKRRPGCTFDWKTRRFRTSSETGDELPYTIWMSDDLQERLMMWEAAKRCRGRVLCGGLGLGVFPQYALSLPRVELVDVVDADADVISLIRGTWEGRPWPGTRRCSIVHMKIEDYLRTASRKYDTVYIDIWDAIYSEYLPHLNWLAELARSVLEPGGEILLWAYDLMVRQFMRTVALVLERRRDYVAANEAQMETITHQYPMLSLLVRWLKLHPSCSEDEFKSEAHRIATRETRHLGVLKLGDQPGARQLLDGAYFR